MADSGTPVLRIGDWRVEPTLDEISKDGSTVKLEPRTMRLLVCLAESAGQVVSVDQLLDQVWKDVVVTPDSVYQAIVILRRSLGDDPKEPRYIANVMRRGYRLIAPVSRETPSVPAPLPTPLAATEHAPAGASTVSVVEGRPEAVSAPRRFNRSLAFGVAVALAIAIAVAVAWSTRFVTPRAAVPAALGPSVAVLPFLDLSEKKDQEYFAEGLSEELIELLSNVPELHVPARTSSFYFKTRPSPIAEIAKALKVENVLEGSVRKSGNQIRVTAQLVRADTGYHIWSTTFDRPADDIFKVQDEIAARVVESLKVSLVDRHVPKNEPAANPEAYDLVLRARARQRQGGDDDYAAGITYLRRAIELDPGYATAWAQLSRISAADVGWHVSGESADRTCAIARDAADRALALNPGLAIAHEAKGGALGACGGHWTEAVEEYKKALALDAGNSPLWGAYSWALFELGRNEDAIRSGQEAVRRDPLNPWSYTTIAWAYGRLGRLRDEEAWYRKAVEADPTAAGVHALHANSLLSLDRPADALKEIDLERDDQFRTMDLPLIYDALGRTEEATREIAMFELKYGDRDASSVAEFYACRGDADHAVLWFEKAVATDGQFEDLPNRVGCLKKVEKDKRFQAIVARMKRPPH